MLSPAVSRSSVPVRVVCNSRDGNWCTSDGST